MKRRVLVVVGGVFFSFCGPQDTGLCDEIGDLKAQVELVMQKNQALEQELSSQREETRRLMERIEELEGRDRSLSQAVEELKSQPGEGAPEGAVAGLVEKSPFGPKLELRGFGDVSLKVEEDAGAEEASSNTFALGQVDLFINSELSDKVSVLNENVFEFESDNTTELDVERLEIKYALTPQFNLRAGRSHTPIGYWNTAYHHSAWMHTTAFRPLAFDWEDEVGIIPVHMVGLMGDGETRFGPWHLDYALAVANGRGPARTTVQNVQDQNDSKAVGARLNFGHKALPGLEWGSSVYVDRIPADPDTAARLGRIGEVIWGGHAAYLGDRAELLGEFVHLNHDDAVSGGDYDTYGLYLQAAYAFDWGKPYYRFDFLDFGDGDPYFSSIDFDTAQYTFGIRLDPLTWNSIKLEYGYRERDDAPDKHLVTVQSAFAF